MSIKTGGAASAMSASVGIATTVSRTYRANPENNQDAAVRIALSDRNIVIVSDGIGSHYAAKEAAWAAVKAAARFIQKQGGLGDPFAFFQSVNQTMTRIAERMRERLLAEESAVLDPNQFFGTTLIVAEETEHLLTIAYVGNGAIFHIRGRFMDFPEYVSLPWSALNLLNPHTCNENGKESLYKYLSPASSPEMATPTVLQISKDQQCGDIILIASDGVYSHDQIQRGTDPEGEVWLSAEKTAVRVIQSLRALFNKPEPIQEADAEKALTDALTEMKEAQWLEDDATLGLLITPAALSYQQRQRKGERDGDSDTDDMPVF